VIGARAALLPRLAFPALLAVAAPVAAHAQDTTARSRTIEELVRSDALRNRIGDPVERRVIVHLPPGYHEEPERRYPVVILLHAFGAAPESWLGDAGYDGLDVTHTLDSLTLADSTAELILVIPDVGNRFGGSWLANSASGGRWEDFIARDLVHYIDAAYRTIPDRRARGIAGQSMGGYGAMRLAAHRPDVFGAALVMSPPMVRDPNPFGESAVEAALASMREGSVPDEDVLARVTLAKAVAFSPDGARPPFFAALPYVQREGQLVRDDAVWDMWTRATLLGEISRASPGLADVRIRLEVGANDPVASDVAALSRALEGLDVPVEMAMFAGDHTVGVRGQFERSVFQWFSAALRAQ
jgi:S-formylglutathione hydrolase FrmB